MRRGGFATAARPGPAQVKGRMVALVAFLALAVGSGCASGAWRARPHFDMVTRDELLATHYQTALDAIEALHANWLESHPTALLGPASMVQVYLDGIRLGGVSELQGLSVQMIRHTRYYTPAEATTRWGIGHVQGVIYVSTHPQDGF